MMNVFLTSAQEKILTIRKYLVASFHGDPIAVRYAEKGKRERRNFGRSSGITDRRDASAVA